MATQVSYLESKKAAINLRIKEAMELLRLSDGVYRVNLKPLQPRRQSTTPPTNNNSSRPSSKESTKHDEDSAAKKIILRNDNTMTVELILSDKIQKQYADKQQQLLQQRRKSMAEEHQQQLAENGLERLIHSSYGSRRMSVSSTLTGGTTPGGSFNEDAKDKIVISMNLTRNQMVVEGNAKFFASIQEFSQRVAQLICTLENMRDNL